MNKVNKRKLRFLELGLLILIGTLFGVTLFGQGSMNIGVINSSLSLKPSFTGYTSIDLGPIGSIKFHSHRGPVAVIVKVNSLSAESAGKLIKSQTQINGITKSASEVLKSTFLTIAYRSLFGGAALTFLLVLISFRRFKVAVYALCVSVALNFMVGFYAYMTYKPAAIKQPVYKGLIASAPKLIGSAKDISSHFNLYRDQMGSLMENVSKLYSASNSIPDLEVEKNTTTFLHISDVHLNPEAWNLTEQLVKEFKVDAVIDTGDISDHGTEFEDSFYSEIPKLKVPYFYVRGNHDSIHTESVISNYPNSRVLTDGEVIDFKGFKVAGIADPEFTPDKSMESNGDKVVKSTEDFAMKIAGKYVDLALIHDPLAVKKLDGLASYILAGHLHYRNVGTLAKGSTLMIEGSTGGSGLRMLTNKEIADPLTATLLYFDNRTHKLKAYDEVTWGGLGSASIQIARKVPSQIKPSKVNYLLK